MTSTGQRTVADVRELLEPAQRHRRRRVRQRAGIRLERPPDAVLDLLGRVRLREHLREEELEEPEVIALPVVTVVLRPPLVAVELVLEPRDDGPLGTAGRERDRRADVDGGQHALRVIRGEQRRPQRAAGERDERRALRPRGVHDGERVGGELALDVGLHALRAVRAPVAAPVEGDHPEVAREERDLGLPEARVDDRPGRHEEHGGLPVAVDLVEDAHAVALDEALLVGVPGAGLLAGPRRLDHLRRHAARPPGAVLGRP
jgi:hypothetical protein